MATNTRFYRRGFHTYGVVNLCSVNLLMKAVVLEDVVLHLVQLIYYLIDHPASQPGPSCSPSCGAPSRQPPWVRGWSRLSPLETSIRGCPPSWEDVMDRDGDGGRPYGGWTIFVDDDNYHIIMTSAPSCRISFSPSTLVHTALCNILIRW